MFHVSVFPTRWSMNRNKTIPLSHIPLSLPSRNLKLQLYTLSIITSLDQPCLPTCHHILLPPSALHTISSTSSSYPTKPSSLAPATTNLTMFSSLTTKLALKKLGLPTSTSKSIPSLPGFTDTPTSKRERAAAGDDDAPATWPPKWLNASALPLTAQTWLSPPPPPVPVAKTCPAVGHRAPVDRSGKLVLGGGRKVVVVFLRCVGCACTYPPYHHYNCLGT